MRTIRALALAGVTFGIALPLFAQVSPPSLEGQSVPSAERSLQDAGYKQTRTQSKDGDTWVYFRNHHNSYYQCIALVTSGGRVETALSLAEGECHKGDDTAAAVVGVAIAAALGAAILGHHDKHHEDGRHHSNHDDEAQYERGYQDGLHNGQFVNYNHNQFYSDGYAAGSRQREHNMRSNRYHHHASQRDNNHRADLAASCAHEADRYWGIRRGSSSTWDVKSTGGGMYTVRVAAGYRTGTCTVSDNGNVRSIMND